MDLSILEQSRGDKGYPLNFTITDSSGAPVDITGSTIYFKLAKEGSTTPQLSTSSVSSTIATSGTCYYTVTSSTFSSIGLFNAELEVNWSTSTTFTVPLGMIRVVEDAP